MANRKTASTAATQKSEPKFPYTTVPGQLRKFLKAVPERPRPDRVNNELLAGWQLGGNNSNSIIRVLKAVGLLNQDNKTTDGYTAFMAKGTGPSWLAARLKETYAPLFQAHHRPDKESDDSLRNLFNIHSGGAEGTMAYQIQTFKALSEHANFEAALAASAGKSAGSNGANSQSKETWEENPLPLTVHVDLHIHLPENKSHRDYAYIIEDIARYIYGRAASADDRIDDQ